MFFSNESSSGLWKKMHNHTGCICSSSLHCVFSCDPLKRSHKRMQSHIDHIYLVLLCCVFSYAPLNRLLVKMKNYIGCNGLTFPRRVLSNGPLNGVAEKSFVTSVALVRLFPTMCSQMSFQIGSEIRCIVALVAFMCFISSRVSYQMCLQIASPSRCTVTLIAFV